MQLSRSGAVVQVDLMPLERFVDPRKCANKADNAK